jgi:flagellar biosynthesis protein FlhF
MNVRTYRAATMRDALDLVRRELGSDAIIFSTRQTPDRRRFPWQKLRHTAEVVAGVAEQTAPLRNSTVTNAVKRRAPFKPRRHAARLRPDRTAAARTPAPQIDASAVTAAVPRDDAVEALIRQLSSGVRPHVRRDIPDELFHLYTRLIDADVHEQDARELVLELPSELRAGLHSPEAVSHALAALVERHVACCGPIRVTPGLRTVAALVGPTGVGKTTTVAKLAANFKLRDGVKVGLVTVDTYRVAAVEQLRTYAEIIDLPMHVVSSPREMRHALNELGGMDLVLIDTAGRSPRDELKIQELKSFLAEADVDQVHLVLSLVAGARSLEQAAEKFRTVGVTSLLLTKLDEAAGAGAILSAAKRIQLPISYLTTGQDVPDDIEAASTPHLSRLIQESIESTSPATNPAA